MSYSDSNEYYRAQGTVTIYILFEILIIVKNEIRIIYKQNESLNYC